FLQEMVSILEPIKRITRHLCGAKYLMLNLVYPYIELLKNKFAPETDKTIDTYLDLIYSEKDENNDESDEITDNDDIPTADTH
ncbi:8777_t:CDS:1, partial [Scutellospora calospora]